MNAPFLHDSDYREMAVHRPAASISETCRCGASFAYAPAFYAENPKSEWMSWQEEHAIVCEGMAKQIAPRLARHAAALAEVEERDARQKARQKEANDRARAKKLAAQE